MPVPNRTQPTQSEDGPDDGWTVLLPLKGGPRAKSRLGATRELADAMALDTLQAALRCPSVRQVRVVTRDAALTDACTRLGALVCPEDPRTAGLSEAVRDCARRLETVPAGYGEPGAQGGPVAILLGDLPALRPEDLGSALGALRTTLSTPQEGCGLPLMGMVPDFEGTGTVLLAAARPDHLTPAFGPGSAQAHIHAGAVCLPLELPRLRRDVDTLADLLQALDQGVGPLTARCLRTQGLPASR